MRAAIRDAHAQQAAPPAAPRSKGIPAPHAATRAARRCAQCVLQYESSEPLHGKRSAISEQRGIALNAFCNTSGAALRSMRAAISEQRGVALSACCNTSSALSCCVGERSPTRSCQRLGEDSERTRRGLGKDSEKTWKGLGKESKRAPPTTKRRCVFLFVYARVFVCLSVRACVRACV